MRSIGIGGDSRLHKTVNGYVVGPEREGPAAAVGGSTATLSDALITAGYVHFGDEERAQAAIAALGGEPQTEARKIVAAAVEQIKTTIREMLDEWAKQPVYTVNDVIKGTEFIPQQLIGVGGGAPGLIRGAGRIYGAAGGYSCRSDGSECYWRSGGKAYAERRTQSGYYRRLLHYS